MHQGRRERRSHAICIGLLVWLVASARGDEPIVLRDVTRQTGIDFKHTDGSSGRRYICENMTAGLALFDFDNDGLIDIYFVNGAPLPGTASGDRPTNRLYRNLGAWKFLDVTDKAGVGDIGYGMGAAAADYDNDGDQDLYVSNYGPNVLYRNNGNGTFTDVTAQAGVDNGDRFGAGVCFLDIDKDGDLDLYAGNYVVFSCDRHVPHTVLGVPSYRGPKDYAPDADTLYRNNGDGTFTDVSEESGIAAVAGTSMGLVAADYDHDGDTDVFIANDVMANFLFQNDGTGRFEDVGLFTGVAFNATGIWQGSMGVDCGDYNNDGWLDFHMTNYQGEMPALYENSGSGFFDEVARRAGAGLRAIPHVTWGSGLVDFDNDGDRDIYIACGHLQDNIELRDSTARYLAPNILLRNTGKGKFRDVSGESGDGMFVELSSRGAGFDDLDNDGDIDVVVLNSRREPTILHNDSPNDHHWIQIQLQGTRTNRDGVGARVRVVSGDLVQVDEVHSGRGYQSHYGTRLHFGLGHRDHIDRIEVQWIGGQTDVVKNVAANQRLTVVESRNGG